jgi:hypothetical protein
VWQKKRKSRTIRRHGGLANNLAMEEARNDTSFPTVDPAEESGNAAENWFGAMHSIRKEVR